MKILDNLPLLKANKIEAVIKRPNRFIAEFYKTLQEKQTPIFFKLFHKTENTGTLTNSCFKASLTLIPKPGQTKKTTRPITPMNIDENFSM